MQTKTIPSIPISHTSLEEVYKLFHSHLDGFLLETDLKYADKGDEKSRNREEITIFFSSFLKCYHYHLIMKKDYKFSLWCFRFSLQKKVCVLSLLFPEKWFSFSPKGFGCCDVRVWPLICISSWQKTVVFLQQYNSIRDKEFGLLTASLDPATAIVSVTKGHYYVNNRRVWCRPHHKGTAYSLYFKSPTKPGNQHTEPTHTTVWLSCTDVW